MNKWLLRSLFFVAVLAAAGAAEGFEGRGGEHPAKIPDHRLDRHAVGDQFGRILRLTQGRHLPGGIEPIALGDQPFGEIRIGFSTLLVRRDSAIHATPQLDGARIAMLSGGVQETALQKMMRGSELRYTALPMPSFAEAMQAVADGMTENKLLPVKVDMAPAVLP